MKQALRPVLGALLGLGVLSTQAAAEGFGTAIVDGVLDGVYGSAEASDPDDDPQGNAPMDLLDLHVCNDNDFWYFHFTVDEDIVATNWGKYILYVDTTADGNGATFDAWGRNVAAIPPHFPEISLNSWMDGGGTYGAGKTQLWSWNGVSWDNIGTATEAALAAGTPSGVEWKVSKAALGNPSTIWCEVFSTSGGETDNAQDTINNPADDWNATDWTTQAVILVSTQVNEVAGSDTTPPTMVSSFPLGQEPINQIEVVFSEPVSSATAENTSNYAVTEGVLPGGISVIGATLGGDQLTVTLDVDNPLDSYGAVYSVEATQIEDLAGNEIVDNGDTNVDSFKIFDLLVKVSMNLYLRENSDFPLPDSVGWEGSQSPLTWDPACDHLLADGDGDSVFVGRYQFPIGVVEGDTIPATTLEYKFTHSCENWESIDNHIYDFANDVGRDTLDIWWNNEAPGDFTTIAVDVIFHASMAELETPPTFMDTVGVAGSYLPLTWDLPIGNMADDGVDPDLVADDGIYSGRFTFPEGTLKDVQYKFAINSAYECEGGSNRSVFLDDSIFSETNPIDMPVEYYDVCIAVVDVPMDVGSATRLEMSIHPNPTRYSAGIYFVAPESASGSVMVFDTSGRRVRTLLRGQIEAGPIHLVFDGVDSAGRTLSPGVYFVRAEVAGTYEAQAVTILR